MTLQVKPIPVPSGATHEETPHEALPNHEFSMGLIAPKGAGKTTLICNLLDYFKNYFHSIIIFSPTVANDEKWDWVKKQRLLRENKPLKRWLEKQKKKKQDNPVVESIEMIEDPLDHYTPEEFDACIPEDCFFSDYHEDDLKKILMQQQHLIEMLKAYGKTKHLANRILFLFDDLVGSSLFSGARKNAFKMLNTNHRHFSSSLIMVSQAFKEIPKTVRTNFSCLILFEIFSDSEIEAIYNEFPMGLKRTQWDEMYSYCVSGDHSFLYYNMQRPKHLRLMKNLNEVVFYQCLFFKNFLTFVKFFTHRHFCGFVKNKIFQCEI